MSDVIAPESMIFFVFSVVPEAILVKDQIASNCNYGLLWSFANFMNKGTHPLSITSRIGGLRSVKKFFLIC